MRINQLVPALAVLTLATTARADEETTVTTSAAKTKTLSVDAAVDAPVGSFSDAVGFGIGALLRFEMPLAPKLTLTGRFGYLQHFSKDGGGGGLGGESASSSVGEVPLLGGVRYAFSKKSDSEIYGAAELGFTYYRVSSSYGQMSNSSGDLNLSMSLGAGYRSGKFDVRGQLYMADLGHAGDSVAVMATAGYQFTAF